MAVVVAAVLAFAAPAAAHDFWLEPSSFTPPAGSLLSVRLLVGQDFAGEAVPRNPDAIVRFDLVGPLGDGKSRGEPGQEEVMGLAGWEPAGRVRVPAPGLHALVYRSTPSPITLPADRFEDYLKQEGLEAVVAARAAAGTGGEPGREIFSRCAKALVEVEGVVAGSAAAKRAAAPAGADRPLGLTLELVSETDPYRLAGGGELPVRLLYRGEPLAGALVVAIPRDEPAKRIALRSDRQGRAVFRLGRGGRWLVKAVHMVPAPAGSGADWESYWASLTFALPAE